MFIQCSDMNNTSFDETLLSSILSKFRLTSLVVDCGSTDKGIFMQLLQMTSIQETLEHFRIKRLRISKCTPVIDILVEFKRIKAISITCNYSKDDEESQLEEWKLKTKQFENKMKKKHSEIEIYIDYQKIYS